ncbi:MAG: MinD/ParA family protein [Sedimentisphaerales bacterium]|nr:MinD/ParA family protein [Sedimentisphaerales bacterium]
MAMVVDQAEKLRLMVRKTRGRRARVIAVTSGKGGVGKSNVAANLSICLAASRRKVTLIDADFGLANLDLLFNARTTRTIAQLAFGRKTMDELVIPVRGGVGLVCGVSGMTELAQMTDVQRNHIVQQMSTLEDNNDMIIVDTGAGISANVLSFCESADHTIIVTTPEPTSMTDAYAMIKALSKGSSGVKLSLLVNMADSRNQARKVYRKLADTARKFLSVSITDAGYILYDESVSNAVHRCEPVVLAYPRSQASYCFLTLASKFGRGSEAASIEEGFFRKVVNWFF